MDKQVNSDIGNVIIDPSPSFNNNYLIYHLSYGMDE